MEVVQLHHVMYFFEFFSTFLTCFIWLFSAIFLSQLALGGCVECVMLSVTRAQPRTVEHVMLRSARAQPRTIFPPVRLFPTFVKFVSHN